MKKNKKNKIVFLMTLLFASSFPLLSYGAVLFCTLAPSPTLGVLLSYITCILTGFVVPLIFALAMVMFIWGVVQYVINTDEEAKKQKGKMFMIWGIIALTVMTSVWGLVGIVGNTFGIKNVIPTLPTGDTGSGTSINTNQTAPTFTNTNTTINTSPTLPNNITGFEGPTTGGL
jgi:hypothetical protein